MGVALTQICLNFVLNNGYLVFLSTNMSCFFTIWGILTMVMSDNLDETSSTIDVLMKIFYNQKYGYSFINLYFHVTPGYFIMWYLLNSIQKEILKAWLQKSNIQKEMDTILSKLEEGIITTDAVNKISFTNDRGNKIIRMITKLL